MASRADKHREARVSTKEPRPLTSARTLHILPQVGPNTLPEPHLLPLWQRVLRAVPDPLVLVLLGAIVLSADVADAIVIALVIVVNTTMAVNQQISADHSVGARSPGSAPTSFSETTTWQPLSPPLKRVTASMRPRNS